MRYATIPNSQNRRENELLEREDKQAGSPQPTSAVRGNASASVGAVAPATQTSSAAPAVQESAPATSTTQKPAKKANTTIEADISGGFMDQLKKEAAIVSHLPHDFPIARWESLNPKQQRHALKFSGLNDRDQWVLLNASAPLSVLDEYNQQFSAESARAHIARLIEPAMRISAEHDKAPYSKRSISTPLQNGTRHRQLDIREDGASTESQKQAVEGYPRPVTMVASVRDIHSQKSFESNSQAGGSSDEGNEEETLWQKITSWFEDTFFPKKSPEPASSTPQVVTMMTVPPTVSPTARLTPTPSPSQMPSLSPTPGLTERQRKANDIVALAETLKDKPYSKKGNTGQEGYDCSGLVRALCRDTLSGLQFKQGYISLSCEDGMSEDFINKKYGDLMFDYHDGSNISSLEPGDLVFFADPNDLSVDKHVAIATGNGLQVIEASSILNKVTDELNAYEKDKGNGIYVRGSGQIITYVIRPYYDWKEQP